MRTLLLLAALALTGSSLSAQGFIEERYRVMHSEPSRLIERIDLLSGYPQSQSRRVTLQADDAADTLIIRIPQDYGDAFERERFLVLMREFVERMDQPEPQVRLNFVIVQTSLLTDAEFATLDDQLRSNPESFPVGVRPKGVVFSHRGTHRPNETLTIDEGQAEHSAITQPDPVYVKGRVLPVTKSGGKIGLITEFIATSTGAPFQGDQKELRIAQSALATPERALVLVGGERLPHSEATEKNQFPGKHEVMVYVWSMPDTGFAVPIEKK
jgi:hypothetical protein